MKNVRKTKIQNAPDLQTVDAGEIRHFSAHASEWWDRYGSYAPLHQMTPARMAYLVSVLGPVKGLKVLDIGCGGGLVSEPLARLGAKVTGVDADPNAIRAALAHAKTQNLSIDYRQGAAEDFVKAREKFDVVLGLEILEHTSSPSDFVELCADLVTPNGKIVFSTLNRTWKSYALGIVAAERLLNWAPEGTHQWNKFIKPSELSNIAEECRLKPVSACGLVYNPVRGQFDLAPHRLDVNYFMLFSPKKRS